MSCLALDDLEKVSSIVPLIDNSTASRKAAKIHAGLLHAASGARGAVCGAFPRLDSFLFIFIDEA